MRLKVTVEDGQAQKVYIGGSLDKFETMEIKDYHCMNDVVIDRGPTPYAIQIEIYIDNRFFTTLFGDG